MSTFGAIPDYLSLAALSGTVLLTPLYVSQRRDVLRLRELCERDPEHPGRDLAASELLLDRAEQELEEVMIATGEFRAVQPSGTDPGQVPPIPPIERLDPGATVVPALSLLTSERPALEQVTMEREALAPHPRWRRFAVLAMDPRTLAVVGLLVVAIGVAALVATGQIFGGGNAPSSSSSGAPGAATAGLSVAVLNGTSDPKLGRQVGRDVTKSGFSLASVAPSHQAFQQTVVMFSPGEKRAATRVARVLSVTPIQPIDSQTRSQAPTADVVVIAGVDRARP